MRLGLSAVRLSGRATLQQTFAKQPTTVPSHRLYNLLSSNSAVVQTYRPESKYLPFMGLATVATATAAATTKTAAITDEKKPLDIVIYQYDICPFCNKVKAVMDYLKIPYTTIEVDPVSKTQLKTLPVAYKLVPASLINGDQVNDSKVILSTVLQLATENNLITPAQIKQLQQGDKGAESVSKWLEWSDKQLAVLIFPNITATLSESLQAFGYIQHVKEWSVLQRAYLHFAGGLAMKLANGKIKKKYNIVDHRAVLYEAVGQWVIEVGTNDFHGGSSPDLADLAVFGVMRAVHHTTTHEEMLKNTKVSGWYNKMSTLLGPGGPYPPK